MSLSCFQPVIHTVNKSDLCVLTSVLYEKQNLDTVIFIVYCYIYCYICYFNNL